MNRPKYPILPPKGPPKINRYSKERTVKNPS